jgi:integrase
MRKIDPVSEWLGSVSYNCSQSKKTEEQYKRVWGRFTTFAETSAEEILSDYRALIQENSGYDTFKRKYAEIIRAWINQLTKEKLTNISIKVMVGAVKSFFKWNDLPLGRVPQAKNGDVFHNKDITKEEITQIIALLKIRERAFCVVMAQSGLRPVTIAQLRMKHLESLDTIPCKIDVPKGITKGKYGSYVTFIGTDAVKYLKQYLATRTNLTPESLVFCSHDDSNKPINEKDMSRAFRLGARKLEESGAIKFEVREGKPSELRLYNLRKFFRKYSQQMGIEVVEYMMGHTVKGVDGNYRPQDPEYYRGLYSEKAMPFLRLESATPTDTEQLRQQHKKEMEDLQKSISERDNKIKELEHTIKSIDEKFSLTLKMLVPSFSSEERLDALKQLEASLVKDGIITKEELDQRAKKLEEDFKDIMQKQIDKEIEATSNDDKIFTEKLRKAVAVLKETQPELFK